MLVLIAACEVGFWVAILAGLVSRYLLRRKRLSVICFLAAPLIDVVLLVATVAHLRTGVPATWEHGLAALYIGFSVAYGHRLIHWADIRFAHRYAGGPRPVALAGRAYTKACWGDVLRTSLATVIGALITVALIIAAADAADTKELEKNFSLLGIIFTVEVLWAVSYTLWPRRPAKDATADA